MKEIVDTTGGVRYELPDEVYDAVVTLLQRTAVSARNLNGDLRVEVRILDAGPRMVKVIKEVRDLTGLSLKNAKYLVDKARRVQGGPPSEGGGQPHPSYDPRGAVIGTVDFPTALKWKAALESAGAMTNVPHPLEALAELGEDE